jgi:pyridoxine 5'-phosphate synthase PdxJ
MSTRTLPRLPLTRHARAGADVADVAATTTEALNIESAATDDAFAVTQAPRMRRTVTIVATALVLSVVATGVATVFVRRYGKLRGAGQTRTS